MYIVIEYIAPDVPQWRDGKKKYNIQGDIKTLLGKDCEMEEDNKVP